MPLAERILTELSWVDSSSIPELSKGCPSCYIGLIKKARLILLCSVLICIHMVYQAKPPIFNQVDDN